uniref:Uncharacterized protein n=1 Tax=Rhizochromulina marina TaxID=1034831 RepID=A0A7S2SS91_9STRA
MAESLEFHDLPSGTVELLHVTYEPAAVKKLLRENLGVEDDRDLSAEQKEVVEEFYFYCYAFCKESGFDASKTSTFMSIAKATFHDDRSRDEFSCGMKQSFARFKELVLSHAVNRSPWAVRVFSEDDVARIISYMLNSYFRHFKMYKLIFTRKLQVTLDQSEPHLVEPPRRNFEPLERAIFDPLPASAGSRGL